MHEITVEKRTFSDLLTALEPERAEQLQVAADLAREVMSGRTVWNVSSTASGGGVAEMLHSLLGAVCDAGIDTRWFVLDAGPEFFTITKRVHNRMHGAGGDDGDLGARERRSYEKALTDEATALGRRIQPGDVVILHDPQTAGLAATVLAAGGRPVWRCHVGLDSDNDHSRQAWAFLRPYVEQMVCAVFSRAGYRPHWLPLQRTRVIAPAIDPGSVKNADMDGEAVLRVLTDAGLLAGEQSRPAAAGDACTAQVGSQQVSIRLPSRVLREGGATEPSTPLVVQVSRWDHLKDMQGVMETFASRIVGGQPEAGAALAEVELWLVGPAVEGVLDDPEGVIVFAECQAAWRALPAAQRRRISLVTLPMEDITENAALVNAVQRHATIVVQKSLVEGFGLTVAEAMWKIRPVVASAVGGILDQITDGESGRLVPPEDSAAFASALVELLTDAGLADRLARAGRAAVQRNFLPDRQLLQWGELLSGR